MDRYSWLSTQFEPAIGMVKRGDGPYVLYTDHIAALTEKDREIERLTEEHRCHETGITMERVGGGWG